MGRMSHFRYQLTPRQLTRWLSIGLVSATLAGCAFPVEQHGNAPPKDVLAQIHPGSTDKETITRLLGSPSTVAAFDDTTWYYISQKSQQVAFFLPETLDQQVLAISFDDKGVVRDMQTIGMAGRNELTPVARTTPAPGKELTFFEQLIGNFGRFSSQNHQN